jgi:hypothetical protein
VVFVALLVATRLGGMWLALHPESYKGETGVAGDPGFYQAWARQIMREDLAPYSEVRIEYPPGILPFITLPQVGLPDDGRGYPARFAGLMLLLDLFAMERLLALARRRGSMWGPWLWLCLIPLLGPISYMRLDMIPATATVLALERADAGRWGLAGGTLSYAVLAKLYPLLLMPIVWLRAPDRRRFVLGALLVAVLGLIGFTGALDDLARSVLGYHSQRGIQLESSWATGLLIAGKLGYPIVIEYTFGALHVASTASSLLKALSNLAAVVVVLIGFYFALVHVRTGDVRAIAGVLLATLLGLLAVGSVFSPQFMLWVFALGAAVLCYPGKAFQVPALALAPAALMSQLIYPFYYVSLLLNDSRTVGLLAARNALVAGASVAAFIGVLDRSDSEEPLAAGEHDHAGERQGGDENEQ